MFERFDTWFGINGENAYTLNSGLNYKPLFENWIKYDINITENGRNRFIENFDRFDKWLHSHANSLRGNGIGHMFDNWIDNDAYIEHINAQNLSYTLGHNSFSGLNAKEFFGEMGFSDYKGMMVHDNYYSDNDYYNMNHLPSEVDWRKDAGGVVTPVKNQGSCGSCWAFSTTGALEGIFALTHGELVSFSEQQLVDCDYGLTKNHGCNGGLMDNAFKWISSNGGLCAEADYSYTGTHGKCQTSCLEEFGSMVVDYVDVEPCSDYDMMEALSFQPVSVALQADQTAFQFYKSGVFTSGDCGTNLNHGVLLVGYGTSAHGDDYYIMKNSWGKDWGDGGYMYLGRGTQYNGGAGQCGVLMEGSFPVL